ncbi:MAG: protein SCO1/2 [Enterobacterales bacterium]|jgi:protein SCO1/2
MSIKNKALGGFFLLAVLVISISVVLITTLPEKPPLINGILISKAVVLDEFSIIDHNNAPFTNRQLEGKWHLLSYGYTNCPDVCPTVLSVLSAVSDNLNQQQQYSDLDILFYTIDHQRDTATHLAEYLPYFNKNFIGLTYIDSMVDTALPFEKSLGMVSILKTVESEQINTSTENKLLKSYTVSHGFMLYLINPQGHLQAVFRPRENKDGSLYFTKQQILDDYLAIRNYLG